MINLFKALSVLTCFLLPVLIGFPSTRSTESGGSNPPVASVQTDLDFDKIWRDEDKIEYNGYSIERICENYPETNDEVYCSLELKKNDKTLAKFDSDKRHWLMYGFFDFLKNGKEQLVIHTYSGGAHCCYSYYIYDLGSSFEELYDSSQYSSNEIGSSLIPVDIDHDGSFEFYQSVMSFDYLAPGGHATSSFPPAIFDFDNQTGKFILANKKFPDFVMEKLKKTLSGQDDWVKDNAKYGTVISPAELREISARHTFLYMVYAGKEKEAWIRFERDYTFEFKDSLRSDFKAIFIKDPTYRSIYND